MERLTLLIKKSQPVHAPYRLLRRAQGDANPLATKI